MKKIVLLVLWIWFINLFWYTFASSWEKLSFKDIIKNKEIKNKKSKKDIMKEWFAQKQQMVKDIYSQTNIAYLMDLNKAASQLDELSSKLNETSLNYKNIKIQKSNVDKKYNMVLKDAKATIVELQSKRDKLKEKLLKIQIISKDILKLKEQINTLKTTLEVSKLQVKKYIWYLYKINNDFYDSSAWLDNIKLLFKSKNISRSLSQEDFIKLLTKKTEKLLLKLDRIESIKTKFLKKVYQKKVEYINNINSYKTELVILNNKRKMLIDLLTMLKSNKKQVDKYYDRVYRKRVNLKKRQVLLIDSLKNKWNVKIETKAIDLSNILKYTQKTDWDKFFNWPSREYFKINAYFHDKNYFKKFWWQHDGIDIAMPQWTPIYAPAAWYVYKVVDNDSTYYNYIVIVHNYGYISIYGHISKALVKQWDIVKRWQIIALSWWEKWTRWAWKMSTWPHLHFELYKNWQHIDPFSVLDLSVYKDKSEVPEKWQLKYIKDSLTRKIDISWIKYYDLKEHKKRELAYLHRAAKWFDNLTWWVQPWKKFGIDPDVAICIWYAESSLWYNTTTKYNVWNVWNNDRWDRQGFSTSQEWINRIYYTLNNKYLSKYSTINKLSRYWNKDSHIYSSSSYNWYKNVVKCLTKIKWHPIDEYYPFRILSNMDKLEIIKSLKK